MIHAWQIHDRCILEERNISAESGHGWCMGIGSPDEIVLKEHLLRMSHPIGLIGELETGNDRVGRFLFP